MKVDFNNVRRQAVANYHKLCEKLNRGLAGDGTLTVDTLDIQEAMDDLRMCLVTIASCTHETDPEIIDVYADLYPGDKEFISFNRDGDDAP